MFPKKFVDETRTVFTKGPFMIDGKSYDYRLRDKDGEDYCTTEQIESWCVSITRIIEK